HELEPGGRGVGAAPILPGRVHLPVVALRGRVPGEALVVSLQARRQRRGEGDQGGDRGGRPHGFRITPWPVRPSIFTTTGRSNRRRRTQDDGLSDTEGCAASHSQSTKPSPRSGFTVKYPMWNDVRFWKKWLPCDGATLKSLKPVSTITRAPEICSQATGIPSHGSREPQRPTPNRM